MEDVDQLNVRRVAIGMGSNLGDSWTILRQACAALNDLPNTRLEGVSRVRLTQPITPGSEGERPPFLNAVALLRTSLPPVSLLKELMTIEASFGRVRTHRWMARTLDLDILLDEAGPFCDQDLFIPHPRLGSRLFFLACLEEILPNWRHPWCNLTAREMIEVLSARPGYFLVVSETFAQANRLESTPDEGSQSEEDSVLEALGAIVRTVSEALNERYNRSQSTASTTDSDQTGPRVTGSSSAADIASLLQLGRPVVQFASLTWLKRQKQQTQERDFPWPRVIVLGPKAKNVLWDLSLHGIGNGGSSSRGLPDATLLHEYATPVVFVECDDPASWAMHIIAAVDASAELGEVLGDLV